MPPKKAVKKSDLFSLFFSAQGMRFLLKDAFSGLLSKDRITRRMSALFFLSIVGVVTVFFLGWQRYQTLKSRSDELSQSELNAKHLGEFFGKQAESARRKYTVADLGTFLVELKKAPEHHDVKGVVNMAEVDVVVECDLKETCELLEKQMSMARDQVTHVLTALDREELMSREGKKRVRRLMQERLNLWLPKGKVENLYFVRLVIS